MKLPLPNKATTSVRQLVLECLRDERFRIYPDGQRYLNTKGIKAKFIIEDLMEDLVIYHLFELPPQSQQPSKSKSQTKIKYQYAISYSDPEVTIHIKISPTDDNPPILYLTFHSHNTGYAPLPQIPITPATS